MYKNNPLGLEERIKNTDPIPPHAYELGYHYLTPTLNYDIVNDIMKLAISVNRHICGKHCLRDGICRFHSEKWKLCKETNLHITNVGEILNLDLEYYRDDFRMN